jgi:hypothetical protein
MHSTAAVMNGVASRNPNLHSTVKNWRKRGSASFPHVKQYSNARSEIEAFK